MSKTISTNRRKRHAIRKTQGRVGMIHNCRAPNGRLFSLEVEVVDVEPSGTGNHLLADVRPVGEGEFADTFTIEAGRIEWATRDGQEAIDRARRLLTD